MKPLTAKIGTYSKFSKWTKYIRKNSVNYLFILPAVLGVFIFHFGPMLTSFWLSMTEYDVISPAQFIGLENYLELVKDPLLAKALGNTFFYVVIALPLRLTIALGAAILLNRAVWGIGIFRTIFYLPSLTAGVAISLLWKLIYEPRFGLTNSLLGFLGIQGPTWLGDPLWALPAIIIMMSFNIGQFMLIFLAGLQTIPVYLYEAVELDGGGLWCRFRYITIPHLTPVIFLNLLIGMIQMMQMFTQVYVMTQGGPLDATLVYVLYLYQRAFQWLQMGYASALAWVFFLMLLTLTFLQFKLSGKWVYYEGRQGASK